MVLFQTKRLIKNYKNHLSKKMKKINLIQRVLFIILLSLLIINTNAQTGLNFQGVARTNNNFLIASQAITIKLSILQGSSTGAAEYTETRTVTTNAQGLFTAVIGDTGAISTLGNFSTINWKLSPKFLKIEMDPAAGINFTTMGTTQFQYVAYAQYAKSVAAENIIGLVGVEKGGTGVNSLAGLKTALALNQINNTTDAEKPISIKTQTALDLISITVTDTTRFSKRINTKANTVDVITALDLKLNAVDTTKYTKQTYSDSALLTKLSRTENIATATTAENITARTNTTLTSLPSLEVVGTITSGVWSGTVVAVEKGGTGVNSLAGLKTALAVDQINNTADADKPISTQVRIVLDLKSNLIDTSKYTKQTYGDSSLLTKLNTSGNAVSATTAGNITATSNTTLTSLSNLETVGTITSGVWSGTAVAFDKGGTGLTSAGASGNFLTSNGTIWRASAPLPVVVLPTIVIGTQQWMRENLDVLTYRNGDVIPHVTDLTAWAGLTTGAWCWYDNDPANGAIYGKLYNWYAVNDSRGLAPQGWHISTDSEWTTLGTLLGGDVIAGGKMKTTGTTRWNTPNTGATNESGFTGLPSGEYTSRGFNYFGESGFWWSSTESDKTYALMRELGTDFGKLTKYSTNKRVGNSVRCIRD